MRIGITLTCEDCKNRNYITNKNKTKMPERFSIKKFCRKCNKRTIHKEAK